MPVYVAEIKSKVILAFHAEDGLAGDRRMHDPLFQDDLMTLSTGGIPLWDGLTDITTRQALPSEEAYWRASRARAIRHGNTDDEDDTWIAFLVPLGNV